MTLQEYQEQQQVEAYLFEMIEKILKKNGIIPNGKCLTIQETAKQLKIHPFTVRKLVTDGKLKAYKIGRRILIDKLYLDKYLSSVEIKSSTTYSE